MEHRGLRAAGLDTGPVRVRVCPAAVSDAGFRHSFESPLSHRWVLAAGPGTSVLASSPPSASPFNPEPTVRRAQSLASQLRLRAERLRGPGLADRTPPHSCPPRPSLAPQLVPRPITEVLRCGHPPLPETLSACTHCPGPVLGEPRAVLLTGSDSVRPCSLTAPITALRKCERGICAASRTHIREAEQFRPNDARTVPGTQRVASTALTEAGSDPDNQRILWVSRSHYCLSPNFPCQLNANRPPPILSSARLGPTEMYLVNKVLKYLKVF